MFANGGCDGPQEWRDKRVVATTIKDWDEIGQKRDVGKRLGATLSVAIYLGLSEDVVVVSTRLSLTQTSIS